MSDFRKDQILEDLYFLIESGERRISLPNLTSSSQSYLVNRIQRWYGDRGGSRNLVVVTSDMKSSHLFRENLEFFCGKEDVQLFPNLSTGRHDVFASETSAIAARNRVLSALLNRPYITVVPIIALLQKTISPEKFARYSFSLKTGGEYGRDELIQKLLEIGYTGAPVVENVGEFSIRGGILDIFSPCTDYPVRIEFLGDQIESFRFFDPGSQMTLKKSAPRKVRVVPVREVVFNEENIRYAKGCFKNFGDANEIPKAERDRYLVDIENRIYFPGIDYFLPFFEKNTVSPVSYFPGDTVFFIDDVLALEDRALKYRQDEQLRYKEALSEKNFYCSFESGNEDFTSVFNSLELSLYFDTLELEGTARKKVNLALASNSDLVRDMKHARLSALSMLDPLIRRINEWKKAGYRTNFVCRTRSQTLRMEALLNENTPGFSIIDRSIFKENVNHRIFIGNLSSGFRFEAEKLVLITDEEVFGERKHVARSEQKGKLDAFLTSFSELKANDFVVHSDHGIGIYRGMTRMGKENFETDFLTLEYRGGDRLYIPVYRLNVIQKHTGGGHPTVDKLGGSRWKSTRKKVRESLYSMAKELLRIYAVREKKKGFCFASPDSSYKAFEATFPFEETPDQLSAFDDIVADLTGPKITDRLICGDAGYGKTEVAIRAAYIAVQSSKQVAVLVPTTLLAEQHFRTFKRRLEGFPVVVEMLSRFRTKSQVATILKEIENGVVDVVIGTHRLLSKDVRFKNPGLLIIDEEQRFGVKHKERLKDYRALVDVLTLTATPIPRTLHLSLMGIRDVSMINTPPVDRLSVRTYVSEYNEKLIRESVLREVHRGGQIFFLHNRVQTINTMADRLREMLPEVSIGVAHGQMSERALENIMREFVGRKFNLLVTSTIIENGIDIPSANTMIVNRADKFGLAQLYQLRGRVGRSRESAYCYLLIPDRNKITLEAKQRLRVIKEHNEPGSGFRIASHDLEIRGGGNILGKDQSGHIEEIGFDLYTELLREAVAELKGEACEKKIDPEISLNIPAFIPDSYINNTGLKLVIYKRISGVSSEDELETLEQELQDRFGTLPDEVVNLLWVMAIKLNLSSLNVTHIKSGNKKLVLTFDRKNPDISSEALVYLMTHLPEKYAVTPEYKLIINLHHDNPKAILHEIRNLVVLLKKN